MGFFLKEPCPVDWDAMTPAGDGKRYCEQCALYVHDLTCASESTLTRLMAKGRLCGRVRVNRAGRVLLAATALGASPALADGDVPCSKDLPALATPTGTDPADASAANATKDGPAVLGLPDDDPMFLGGVIVYDPSWDVDTDADTEAPADTEPPPAQE